MDATQTNLALAIGGTMYLKQFYLGCLSHGSYLIGSNGEGAVIDPQRDIEQYIQEAEKEGAI